MRKSAIALVTLATFASASALADAYRDRDRDRDPSRVDARATIEALERRDDALQRESMAGMHIGAVERREIAEQRDLIDDLIDRLERGETVDRYSIDRAFGQPFHADHDHAHFRG